MGSEVDRIKNPWLAKMTLWLKSVFDLLIVRSVFNKIQFNPKIWCIYDFIYQRRAFFSSKPFLEKTKWFYFLCTSKLQFTQVLTKHYSIYTNFKWYQTFWDTLCNNHERQTWWRWSFHISAIVLLFSLFVISPS